MKKYGFLFALIALALALNFSCSQLAENKEPTTARVVIDGRQILARAPQSLGDGQKFNVEVSILYEPMGSNPNPGAPHEPIVKRAENIFLNELKRTRFVFDNIELGSRIVCQCTIYANGVEVFNEYADPDIIVPGQNFITFEGTLDFTQEMFRSLEPDYADKTDTEYTVPSGFTKIVGKTYYDYSAMSPKLVKESVFKGYGTSHPTSTLESVKLPATIKKIGEYAFYELTTLKSVTFDDASNIEEIEENAFAYTGIERVALERLTKLERISGGVFANCDSLESITIPANVKAIESNAFQTSALKNITFAEGSQLETIYANAFINCASLEKITLPETVNEIGTDAFYGCEKLEYIIMKSTTPPDLRLNNSGDTPFYECGTALTNGKKFVIYVPAGCGEAYRNATDKNWGGLNIVEGGVFDRTKLQATLTEDRWNKKALLTTYSILPLFTSIADGELSSGGAGVVGVFDGFTRLESVTLPDTITTIGENAFYGCVGLGAITIPAGVISIGNNAFANNAYLGEHGGVVDLSKATGLKTIGAGVFQETSLANIKFPPNLEMIGGQAFENTDFESITIPASVKTIGLQAFNSCSDLEYVIMESATEVPNIMQNAFPVNNDFNGKKFIIYVPEGKTALYQAGNGWTGLPLLEGGEFTQEKFYATLVNGATTAVAITEYSIASVFTSIADGEDVGGNVTGVFKECAVLENVTLPKNITSIGDYAFYYCTALEGINLNDATSLIKIGKNAFSSTKLTSITIPATVTGIGDGAFSACAEATSLTFAATSQLETIGTSAFSAFGKTTFGITIPASVTKIDSEAFTNAKFNSIEFATTTGWSSSSSGTVEAIDVTDPGANATNLCNENHLVAIWAFKTLIRQ